jgi:hypothetical protein
MLIQPNPDHHIDTSHLNAAGTLYNWINGAFTFGMTGGELGVQIVVHPGNGAPPVTKPIRVRVKPKTDRPDQELASK